MNCTEFRDRVVHDVTENGSTQERAGLQEHAAACTSCRREREAIEGVWGLNLSPLALDDAKKHAVLERALASTEAPAISARGGWIPLSVIAATVLLCATIWWVRRPDELQIPGTLQEEEFAPPVPEPARKLELPGGLAAWVLVDDGKALLGWSPDGKVHRADLKSGVIETLKGDFQGGKIAAFSPDGKRLAVWDRDSGSISVWDVRTAKQERTLDTQGMGVRGHNVSVLAFSPDGTLLAAGSGYDAEVRVWNLNDGTTALSQNLGYICVGSLLFSPDGKSVGAVMVRQTGGAGSEPICWIPFWDIATMKEELWRVPEMSPGWPPNVVFSPDGRLLAVTSGEMGSYSVSLWDVKSRREVRKIEANAPLAFSPDGRVLVTGYGGDLCLWEVASGKAFFTLKRPPAAASSFLAFLPDGRRLLSVYPDKPSWILDTAPPPEKQPSDAIWKALADGDPAPAWRAIWTLAAGGDRATAFLKTRLERGRLSPERFRELLADLESEDIAVRDKAAGELEKAGEENFLRKALEDKPSAERRARIETVLESLGRATSGEPIRKVRIVQILKRIGTPAARELLDLIK